MTHPPRRARAVHARRCLLRLAPLFGLVLLAQSACGDSETPLSPEPLATPLGTSAGPAVSATVGAAGGSVASADGKVSLLVPAGALESDTTITITPLTNEAHGGIGAAYRLTPEGQTFTSPVELRFAYADEDWIGSAEEALGVAFQRGDGLWEWAEEPVLDRTTKTVTVAISHFSDWSLVKGFQLVPQRATVEVGKTVSLEVVNCYEAPPTDDLLAPLGYRCEPDPEDLLAPLLPVANVREWAVDGVVGGTASTGRVAGNETSATFTAPADVPSPDTVAVSARMDRGLEGEVLVVAAVKVVEAGDYVGTLQFSMDQVSGTAHVAWTKFEDEAGVRRYLPSGTMDLSIHAENCDVLDVTLPIETGSAASPRATLVVYTASNPAYPNQYQYTLSAAGDVTLSCGTPRQAVTLPASYLATIMIGSCPGASFATYTDEAILEASGYSCAEHTVSDASWRFTAQ